MQNIVLPTSSWLPILELKSGEYHEPSLMRALGMLGKVIQPAPNGTPGWDLVKDYREKGMDTVFLYTGSARPSVVLQDIQNMETFIRRFVARDEEEVKTKEVCFAARDAKAIVDGLLGGTHFAAFLVTGMALERISGIDCSLCPGTRMMLLDKFKASEIDDEILLGLKIGKTWVNVNPTLFTKRLAELLSGNGLVGFETIAVTRLI